MSDATKSKLQKALEDAGRDCRSYSGRGMYGENCLGLTIERGDNIVKALAEAAEAIAEDVGDGHDGVPPILEMLDAASDMSEDSMGRGTIYYWPRIPFVADPKNAAREEDE